MSPALQKELARARLFLCDVAGVLTDGAVLMATAWKQRGRAHEAAFCVNSRTGRMNSARRWVRRGGSALALSAAWQLVHAQLPEGPVRGFTVPVVDRATGKRKALLRGESARALSPELWEVVSARLENYSADDQTNLIVLSERCLYQLKTESVSSSDPLQVATADGQLALQGVGFCWDATNGLAISNRVQAAVRKSAVPGGLPRGFGEPQRTLAEPAAGAAQAPRDAPAIEVLRIYSDQFHYRPDVASFSHQVRVDDPQGVITCETLTMKLRMPARQLDTIEAETEVKIESGALTAIADRAVYHIADELVELEGNPAWRMGSREGRAEFVRLNRRTRQLNATRQVRMKLPSDAVWSSASLLPDGTLKPPSASAEPRWIEVLSDDFELKPDPRQANVNVAVFRQNVVVKEEQGSLQCGLLEVTSSLPGHQPLTAVAEGNVTFLQPTNRLTCARAVYVAAAGTVVMTGTVAWQFGEREGQSDELLTDLRKRSSLARGHVRMRLAPGSVGPPAWLLPKGRAKPGEMGREDAGAASRAGKPVEISCDEFEYTSASEPGRLNVAVYRGHVRVSNPPDMTLTCDRLTANIDAATNQVRQVVADRNVEIRVVQPPAERVARGDQAVYASDRNQVRLTAATGVEVVFTEASGVSRARGRSAVYDGQRDTLDLDGNPTLTSPQGNLTGDGVRLDRANTVLSATGRWKIRLPAKSLGDSVPLLPRK